jgi:hypothetical protein
MSTDLDNLVAVVVSRKSKRFRQLARVVKRDGEGHCLLFEDGKVVRYSNSDSFEIYYRSCDCNGAGAQFCEHADVGLGAVRDRFCELNGTGEDTSRFCGEYGKLFYNFR